MVKRARGVMKFLPSLSGNLSGTKPTEPEMNLSAVRSRDCTSQGAEAMLSVELNELRRAGEWMLTFLLVLLIVGILNVIHVNLRARVIFKSFRLAPVDLDTTAVVSAGVRHGVVWCGWWVVGGGWRMVRSRRNAEKISKSILSAPSPKQ